MYYSRKLSLALLLCCTTLILSAQVGNKERTYPVAKETDSKAVEALLEQFEETNVGNLHVYTTMESQAPLDYYFKGKALPRGLYGMFDQDWRNNYPQEFAAYAVYEIKGGDEPYFIVRTSGAETYNTIELFRLNNGKLKHVQTLAAGWCEGNTCMQQDSWLQDLDGDTKDDIIKKVRIYKKDSNKVVGDYYAVFKQLADSKFQATGTLPIEIEDYIMEEL